MLVYAGKYGHFPENSNIEAMIRFESEALGATEGDRSEEILVCRSFFLMVSICHLKLLLCHRDKILVWG